MKNILQILILSTFLLACNKNKQILSEEVKTLKIENNSKIDIVEKISFLPIKEQRDFLFSSIDKIIIKGDYIFILDKLMSKSLLCFSKTGDFINRIGNIGQGPGEYIRLWDFDVTDDFIFLYDRNQKKMLQFDLRGNFITEKKTSFRATSFKVLPNGFFLFSLVKEEEKSPLLVKTNENFQNTETIFKYSKDYIDDKVTNNILRNHQDGVLFNKAVNDSVYFLDKEGKLKETYLIDFGSNSTPFELKNSYEKLINLEESKYSYLVEAPITINNRYLIGESFYQGNKATVIYDLEKNESRIAQWLPKKINLKDIILPLTSFESTIVGWMDSDVYENLVEKPTFSEAYIKHLEEGGKILVFYHIAK